MDNFVQRLRDQEMSFSECWDVMPEAADRIEGLEAALREIANHWAPSVNEWATKFKSIASKALSEDSSEDTEVEEK